MLVAGMKAPDFALPDKEEKIVKLSDFHGKKVILYFYPKDATPGCTRQACSFRNHYAEYQEIGIEVIGISKDSSKSHAAFADKQELPFILLADEKREAIEAYGVWQEKKAYGKVSMGIVRSTFIINEAGIIEKVYPNANPDTNAEDILGYLKG